MVCLILLFSSFISFSVLFALFYCFYVIHSEFIFITLIICVLLLVNFCTELKKVLGDDARLVKKCEKWPKNGPKTALFEPGGGRKVQYIKMSADSPYT
jgi:hypothetical protein